MEYISAAEAARRWGVGLRQAERLLRAGRVAGAKKCGVSWLIPAGAKKPGDPRGQRGPEYLPYVFLTSAMAPPEEEAARRQYEAELCYLRGDFAPVLAYADGVTAESPVYLCSRAIAAAAAISLADYGAYSRAAADLEGVRQERGGTAAALCAEAALANSAVSLFAPENAPEWLSRCDFAAFPPESRGWLSYMYVKLLQNRREHRDMLASARMALALLPDRASPAGIYLHLMCAAACHALGLDEGTADYLDRALALALPQGFTAPFAETAMSYGATLEKCLMKYPEPVRQAIPGSREEIWKNWLAFHNRFARDNIALVLTLREYQLAGLLAGGATYAGAARRMNLSLSRIKDMVSSIYGKLYISDKRELERFVL